MIRRLVMTCAALAMLAAACSGEDATLESAAAPEIEDIADDADHDDASGQADAGSDDDDPVNEPVNEPADDPDDDKDDDANEATDTTADADPDADDTGDGDSDADDAGTDDADDIDTDADATESDAELSEARELTPVSSGDSGDDVLALQERLDELGFAPGTPDGSFGKRTTKAIAAFQQLVGIAVTGEADRGTINALADYRYDGLVLKAGDEGDEVEALQLRLADGPFDPGPVDGKYGTGTVQAVWALEKLTGIPIDGDWGPLDEAAWERLAVGRIRGPQREHDTRWVEFDLSDQLVRIYDPGSKVPTLVSHASSGSGVPWKNEDHSGSSVTPVGEFHINRRISGWRESSLNIGRLYNPLYFNGGIAFHGANSVPLYPASHGCVRLPMHIADYLPAELPNGTPVHILR